MPITAGEFHHTFSFADYYDPAQMGFRSLRVINDDALRPARVSVRIHIATWRSSATCSKARAAQGSMGNGSVLKPGQIQLMSAGSGVAHSEFNPSGSDPLHFLQIWIQLATCYSELH